LVIGYRVLGRGKRPGTRIWVQPQKPDARPLLPDY
jgi:hypothetical protein